MGGKRWRDKNDDDDDKKPTKMARSGVGIKFSIVVAIFGVAFLRSIGKGGIRRGHWR